MKPVQEFLTGAWHGLSTQDKFRRYVSALGVPVHQNRQQIEQRLKREFPNEWKDFRALVKRRELGDLSEDLYAVKNKNLQFSLLATALERRNLHALAFSSVDKNQECLADVLDVGCENGFLTCLFALRWPDAQVVGLDKSQPSVDCAKQLAAHLGIANVRFEVANIEDIPIRLSGKLFNLITTITVLHEAGFLPSPSALNRRNAEIFTPLNPPPAIPAFSFIAGALARQGGRWYAMERCQSPATFSAWCQALEVTGLGTMPLSNSSKTQQGSISSLVTS